MAPAIHGEIESLDVNTVGTGSWTFVVRAISDNLPQGYRVTSTHTFSSSFSAYSACQNTSTAFNPAVQTLLNDIFSNPQFTDLVAG